MLLRNKLRQTPNVVGQPRLHRRRDSVGEVRPAEVVPGEVQGDSRLVVRQRLTVGVRQAREAAQVHPQAEVLPLRVARRDVLRVGSAVSNLGYNLHDWGWGVPLSPALGQFWRRSHFFLPPFFLGWFVPKPVVPAKAAIGRAGMSSSVAFATARNTKSFSVIPCRAAQALARRTKSSGMSRRLIVRVSMQLMYQMIHLLSIAV